MKVREVRHREREVYLTLINANAGALDRRLGFMERTDREFRSLLGLGPQLLLRLMSLRGRGPLRMLVADEQGMLVGTTVTVLVGPWAYVAAVGVREDRRRQGVAQALLGRAEEIGRRAHKTWMVLEAEAENAPARHLYSKLGWSAGARVHWWQLPSTASGRNPSAVRFASRKEARLAHSMSAKRMEQEFPRRFLSPCEFACRGSGGSHETFAVGPMGAPCLVLRYWTAHRGESGFLVPVVIGEPHRDEEDAVLEAGRTGLLRGGSRGFFVPVLGNDPHLEALLRQAGGTLVGESEFWSKRIGA